jgi:hypothetical protein
MFKGFSQHMPTVGVLYFGQFNPLGAGFEGLML